MKIIKENGTLKFYLDDNSVVSYDLKTNQTIGKKGIPVKSLNSQLRGYSISDILLNFEDKNYAKFLNNVLKYLSGEGRYITNFGTLLEKSKSLQWMESWSSQDILFAFDLEKSFKEVPNWLKNLCKEKNYKLTRKLYDIYIKNPDVFQGVYNYVNDKSNNFPYEWSDFLYVVFNCYYGEYFEFIELVSEYGYEWKPLLKYIEYLHFREAENKLNLKIIVDEARMRKTMATEIINGEFIVGKFDRYVKNIRTTHNITSRNYLRYKKEYDETLFSLRIRKELEYQDENFCIIYPSCTNDIKREGINQSNCVSSYISLVIDGKCDIVFLRDVNDKEKSMVTVEIRNNKIVQTEGTHRRDTTKEEKEFLKKYQKNVLDKLRNK